MSTPTPAMAICIAFWSLLLRLTQFSDSTK